ncbi:uncharacterized protein [Bos taurus]|uniref:uncharacterized protein isoform X3 n=1 Tax=Bos taurus TaxID=9913 RepID=UPI0028CB26FD|nr:uncharacterized protein LOC104970180 isoform X3 [Bos taurus]
MAGRPTQARPHPPAHPSSLRRFVATPTCRIARARQRCRQAQPGRSSFLTCADYPRPRMLGEDLEWYLLFPARLPPSSDYGCLLMRGSRACRLQQSWLSGLVAPRHVGSSWTRDRTCDPGIGRWILYHWTTREVQRQFKNISISHILHGAYLY